MRAADFSASLLIDKVDVAPNSWGASVEIVLKPYQIGGGGIYYAAVSSQKHKNTQ